MAKKKVKKKPAPKSKRKSATRKRSTARRQATQPAEAKAFQCGQACPQNAGSGGSHHGTCYLDVGHIASHKCSVDGFEWS